MWLISTETDLAGNPITPTNLNLGTIWFMIEGENDATLNPGAITENTFYVRCARNFSCCSFGESNIVSFMLDEAATCPVDNDDAVQTFEDCANPVVLRSPDNDFLENQQMIFITNRDCLLYTSPSPRDRTRSRMPSSA